VYTLITLVLYGYHVRSA